MSRLFARVWPLLPPVRWTRTLLGLARGLRIHPGAVMHGAAERVSLARGCKLSKGVVLDPGCIGSISLGRNVWLASDVVLETSARLAVGDDTTIQRRSSINGTARIGNFCILAPNVFISSGTHPFRTMPHLTIREQERLLGDGVQGLDRPVWIQDDCWLGTNVVVMPGVTVGKGSIVGANSVVTHDVTPYSVVAGAPALFIGQRLEWSPPSDLQLDRDEHLPYVLSGRIERDGGGRLVGVRIDASNDCWIALPPIKDSIRMKLQAVAKTRLMIGGHTFPVEAGSSSLIAPVASLPPHDPHATYCIHIASDEDPRIKILIERIECF